MVYWTQGWADRSLSCELRGTLLSHHVYPFWQIQHVTFLCKDLQHNITKHSSCSLTGLPPQAGRLVSNTHSNSKFIPHITFAERGSLAPSLSNRSFLVHMVMCSSDLALPAYCLLDERGFVSLRWMNPDVALFRQVTPLLSGESNQQLKMVHSLSGVCHFCQCYVCRNFSTKEQLNILDLSNITLNLFYVNFLNSQFLKD